MLFFIVGNMTCDLLLYQKPLWEFTDIIGSYVFLSIGLMLLLYPATVILFFTFLPSKPAIQVVYILLWTAVYAFVELISLRLNLFAYHNGWNFYYTIAHNIFMFALIRLHFSRPLLSWPAAALMAFAIIWFFRIPIELVR